MTPLGAMAGASAGVLIGPVTVTGLDGSATTGVATTVSDGADSGTATRADGVMAGTDVTAGWTGMDRGAMGKGCAAWGGRAGCV
ncbi:MAG: hypothetical protein MUC79_06640 [Thiobacillaceae bacterium]|nr:hypothetical protein [Thiobacillaceae bacterium]